MDPEQLAEFLAAWTRGAVALDRAVWLSTTTNGGSVTVTVRSSVDDAPLREYWLPIIEQTITTPDGP